MSGDGGPELEEVEELEARDALRSRSRDVATLAQRSALNFVGGALFGLFGFVALVIVARGLGPKEAGTFLEGVAFFTIATSIVVLGFDESAVRAVSQLLARGDARSLRRMLVAAMVPLFAFAMLVALAAWVFAPAIARSVQSGTQGQDLTTSLRIFGLTLPFTAMYYAILAATRGFGTMGPTVIIERVGRTFAQMMGAALVVAFDGGVIAMTVAWALPFVVGLLPGAWRLGSLIRRAEMVSTQRSAPPHLAEAAREFWGFSSLRGLASIFQTSFLWLDTLIVGALVSASATAIYTTSSRMVRLGSLVLLAIIQAVGPQLSELLTRAERSRAQHVYRISTWWLMTLTWPLYIMMAVFAPLLLHIFGADFPTGAEVVVTMSTAMLLSTAMGVVDMVLLMGGKSGWNLLNSIVALATNITLNLILVPHLGIEGAALAWAASVALNNLLPYVEVRAMFHMSPFAVPGAIPAVGSLISYGIVGVLARVAMGPTFAGLMLTVVVGSVLYLAVLRRFRSPLELRSLAASFRRRSGPSATTPPPPIGVDPRDTPSR